MGKSNEFGSLRFEIRIIKMARLRLEQATTKGQAHLQFAQSKPANLILQKSLPFLSRIDVFCYLVTIDNKTSKNKTRH